MKIIALDGMERDYILRRSKTLIENKINNIKRIGLYYEE